SCTYNGYVAGFPNSLVTLSICSGLRGTIQFQNVSYGIEPVEIISGFVHVIYDITNDITEIPVLEEDQSYYWYNDSQFQFGRNVKKTSLVKLSPRYFEMDIVVDKKLIKPINILCRKSADECDFPEYCNGNFSYCVRDTYMRDGEYCDSGQAFCYHGLCRTTDKQCINLLGKGKGHNAPLKSDYPNTKIQLYTTKVCHLLLANVLLGKLVCTWPFKRILKLANISTVYTHVQNDVCISLYKGGRTPKNTLTTYSTIEDRDETFVEDGTICGPDMVI
ncbi:Putative disintegrin and metalloproteinase domain-containing protein 5, partial [Lemmus lemmus]